MRPFLLSIAIAATTLAVAACGDLTGVSDELVDTYQLRTIDGQALPVTFVGTSGSTTYFAGQLELDGDGTFDRSYQTSLTGPPNPIHILGTWERIGSAVRLERAQEGGRVYGKYTSPNTIVVHDEDGTSWEYQR